MIITCQRETCGKQFSGISQDQLDEVLELDGAWQCPACGYRFDPYEAGADRSDRAADEVSLDDFYVTKPRP